MQNRNYLYRSYLYSFLLFTIYVIFIYTYIYIQIFFTNNSLLTNFMLTKSQTILINQNLAIYIINFLDMTCTVLTNPKTWSIIYMKDFPW